ncbi:MAG: MarR family transcriptional regulator [Alphaproteobacteria bacterium]|nr:MarR family transcriptional regulator [Alphaproteobacteria bacterium]
MTDKPLFAPLPLQLIGDARLSRTDIDVVAVVAWHHRLGRNGRGCYAGNATLAREVGIQESHLSRSLTKLEQLGIIERHRDPEDRRKRIYHLNYLDNPRIVTNTGKYSPAPTASAEIVTKVGNDSAEYLPNDPEIVTNEIQQVSDINKQFSDNKENRCSKTKNRYRETGADAPSEGISLRSIEGKRDSAEAGIQVERVSQQRALEGRNRAVEKLNAAVASLSDLERRDVFALRGDEWTAAFDTAVTAELGSPGEGVRVLLRAAAQL